MLDASESDWLKHADAGLSAGEGSRFVCHSNRAAAPAVRRASLGASRLPNAAAPCRAAHGSTDCLECQPMKLALLKLALRVPCISSGLHAGDGNRQTDVVHLRTV